MFDAIKKQIPNLFTLGNLCCGIFAILLISDSRYERAAYFILLAVVFDFFDGFLARLLKVSGALGKQLDSLADLVTFGVAPAIMLYVMGIQNNLIHEKFAFILLAIFSAYRLAKFNIDTRQSTSFIGVPTPITGIMVASWAFIQQSHPAIYASVLANGAVFVVFCAMISLLLVSEIPLPTLKFKKGPLKDYWQQLMLLGFSIVCILLFQWLAVPIIYCFYVLSSVIINFAANKEKMKFLVEIDVMPRKELLDPQGKAVTNGLHNIGFTDLDNVRVGKHITYEVQAENESSAKEQAEKACKNLLANLVMESYHIHVSSI